MMLCDHLNYVDDFNTGDTICIDCGIVLTDNIIFGNKVEVHFTNDISSISVQLLDIIINVCENKNISPCIKNDAIHIASKSKAFFSSKRYNNYLIASYCLYEAFFKCGLGYRKSIKDIVRYFDGMVKENELWKICKNNIDLMSLNYISVEDVLPRIRSRLGLTYNIEKQILSINEKLNNRIQIKCNILVAIILSYISNYSLKELSYACDTTEQTLKYYINKHMYSRILKSCI